MKDESTRLEEVQALGFATIREAEEHEEWLWKTSGPSFKNWLRNINPLRADELDKLTA